MREWSWLSRAALFAVHDAQLAEHSGQSGVRDIALLDTILARPAQLAASGDATAAHLAASYGYGIALERPFLLGNARTAFVALELFLQLNSQRLTADNAHCVLMMRDVAARHISEEHFADWVAEHLAPLDAAWEKSKI